MHQNTTLQPTTLTKSRLSTRNYFGSILELSPRILQSLSKLYVLPLSPPYLVSSHAVNLEELGHTSILNGGDKKANLCTTHYFFQQSYDKICSPKSTNFHLPNKRCQPTKCNVKYRSIFLQHHQFHLFEVTKHFCRRNVHLPSTISIICPSFYIHCPLLSHIHLYLMLPSPFTGSHTWLLVNHSKNYFFPTTSKVAYYNDTLHFSSSFPTTAILVQVQISLL